MGKGKTTSLIKECNKPKYGKDGQKRFIIAVTLKTEIERILAEVKEVSCKTQRINGHKLEHLKEQIKKGENIVCTHSLFNMVDDEVIQLIKESKFSYDLYHDEQPITFTGIFGGTLEGNFSGKASGKTKEERAWNERFLAKIGEDEIYSLFKADILVRESNLTEKEISDFADNVHYKRIILNENYKIAKKTIYKPLYEFMKTHTLYAYGDNKTNAYIPTTLITFTKIDIFTAFSEVWVLSYLIKGSILENYLDLNLISREDIHYYHVENNEFIEGYKFEYPSNLVRLSIYNENNDNLDKTLHKVAYLGFKNKDFENLYASGRNFIRKMINQEPSAKNCIVTTFSGYENKIKQGRKKFANKCFVPCNIKATNDYQEITEIIYFCDRRVNPLLKQFLNQLNIPFDEKLFSLSEIVQLVWRSNIRVQESIKPVHVYIPNKRMRDIFSEWLVAGSNIEVKQSKYSTKDNKNITVN